MYEVYLIRIKEQVGEKRSTCGTHRYVDCVLKNTSTKDNKYVVNQKLEHVGIIYAGFSNRQVAWQIGVYHYVIDRLMQRLQVTGIVDERPRSDKRIC